MGDGISGKELPELDDQLMAQIEHFFVSYNRLEGKKFKVLGRGDPKRARKLIQKAHAQFEKGSKKG